MQASNMPDLQHELLGCYGALHHGLTTGQLK